MDGTVSPSVMQGAFLLADGHVAADVVRGGTVLPHQGTFTYFPISPIFHTYLSTQGHAEM